MKRRAGARLRQQRPKPIALMLSELVRGPRQPRDVRGDPCRECAADPGTEQLLMLVQRHVDTPCYAGRLLIIEQVACGIQEGKGAGM